MLKLIKNFFINLFLGTNPEIKEDPLKEEYDGYNDLLQLEKELILKEKGKVYCLQVVDDFDNRVVPIGYYENIRQLALKNGFNEKTAYRGFNEKRTFKKIFRIECQES